jgi:dTDP-4-amino-4,6-dideoxygalactose transaminase
MMDAIGESRREKYAYYLRALEPLERDGLLRLPRTPEACRSNHHLFYVLLRDGPTRDALAAHLRGRGILAVFHYVPLHTSPMGRRYGYAEGDLPVTEDVAGRLLRLPLFHEITADEQRLVVEQIRRFFLSRKGRSAA